jgi:hypothetical protein
MTPAPSDRNASATTDLPAPIPPDNPMIGLMCFASERDTTDTPYLRADRSQQDNSLEENVIR